jgi:hypothetical protein
MTSTIPEKSVRVQLVQEGGHELSAAWQPLTEMVSRRLATQKTYVRDVELAAL